MADPRNIHDLEEENISLKEQMIHAMLTLEQYLSVAYMKFNENPTVYQDLIVNDHTSDSPSKF